MKRILLLFAMLSAIACSSAKAAIVSITPKVYGGFIRSLYVNSQADVIDTIDVKITPSPGTTFINSNNGLLAGAPRPAGQAFTYPNRMLNAFPGDIAGGQGWTFFGLTNNANTLEFTGTPIGSLINTNNAPLFIGNVMLSSNHGSARFVVKGLRLGVEVFNVTLAEGLPELPTYFPEPTSSVMAGIALIGMIGVARRRK